MLIRTHLAINIFFAILFFNSVENKIIFSIIFLFATFLPDIDTPMSSLGRKKPSRIIQLFVKHRGITHSFSLLIFLTLILVLFLPAIAFPFFLGYSLHLFADSFTIDGIRPFYPSKKSSSWKIRTGKKLEVTIFIIFIALDLLLLMSKFS